MLHQGSMKGEKFEKGKKKENGCSNNNNSQKNVKPSISEGSEWRISIDYVLCDTVDIVPKRRKLQL